jgi:hypothetical protein
LLPKALAVGAVDPGLSGAQPAQVLCRVAPRTRFER